MSVSNKSLHLLRALTVIGAAGIISTGVTFAALQSSTSTLTNNAIKIGAPVLQISTNGSTFTEPSTAGFSFDGVIPGGSPVPANGQSFYLKNNGTTALILKVSISNSPSDLGSINMAKTYFIISRADGSLVPTSFSLANLTSANSTGGLVLGDTLTAGTSAQYIIKASMDIDAYSGTGAGALISGINLSFVGVPN